MADRDPLLLPLILVAGGLLYVGAGARLPAAEVATVGSDALGQYAVALQVLQGGGWPHPPNPEGGHSLWLTVLPLLPFADSLTELFRLRFALGAVVAPLGAAAAWLLAPDKARGAAAVAAGTVLALDVGLVDTLTVSFRGYGGPEWLAVATLGGALAATGRGWGLLLAVLGLVAASGQHPFATGAALGGLLALPGLWPRAGRWRWAAAGLLVALLVPRLLHLAWLADCGEGAMACLGRVATGSAEPDTPRAEMIRRAFNDRVLVEGWWPWPVMAAGWGLLAWKPDRPRRAALAWALGGALGITAMGLLAESLRPYHLRMAMPGLAVAAAVGLARWPRLPLVLAAAAALQWGPGRATPSAEGPTPRDADAVARAALAHPGPVRVEAAWWDRPVGLDPLAVSLAAWLQSGDPARLTPTAEAPLVLLAHDPPEAALEALPAGAERLSVGLTRPVVLRFRDVAQAESWMATFGRPQRTDAGEWAGVLGTPL